MDKEFLNKLRDLLLTAIPEERMQEAVKQLKEQLNDESMQALSVLLNTQMFRQLPPDSFPVMVLTTAWSANTLLRTCPIPEMKHVIRDYLIDAIMKGDSDVTIFPKVEK